MNWLKMVKEAASLKSKAMQIEKNLEDQRFEVSVEGIVITANAKQEILDIKISPRTYERGINGIEKNLLEGIKEVSDKAKKIMALETKKIMGDLNMDALKNMLGQ